MSLEPEIYGRQTAETLVGGLEQLKRQLIDQGTGSLDEQLRAGQAAVEAMKRLLGGISSDMRDER